MEVLMVQVDVFWSYALGASFASAAARQLKEEKSPFASKYFTYTAFYLACIFAPSGLYLLWEFPHWETMQVAKVYTDIPGWLVVIFGVTNVLLGVLGFWVAWRFIQKGNFYMAHIQWLGGYFFMFFILLYGWDGTGWQRFLWDPTVNNGRLWEPGLSMGFSFLTDSRVAYTLYCMGIFVIPFLIVPMAIWIREGLVNEKEQKQQNLLPGHFSIYAVILACVFGLGLGSAAIAGLMADILYSITGNVGLAILLGITGFALSGHYLLFQRGMPGNRVFAKLYITDEVEN